MEEKGQDSSRSFLDSFYAIPY